ncbi:MAG: type II secretion system protein GspM [Myxococcota bacterium]
MAARDAMDNARRRLELAIDNAQQAYQNLNDREQKLVAVLGAVLVGLIVLLPLFLMNSAISDLEQENRAIAEVLRDIDRARPTLRQREAERQAAMRLYDNEAPPLGSFLEKQAKEHGITVREVNDQPEKDLGDYRRRHVRVTLPNVGLAEVVKMMASIENSGLPVALERVHVDHFRTGNRYNVQLGVMAYDRKDGAGRTEARGSKGRQRRPRAARAAGGKRR